MIKFPFCVQKVKYTCTLYRMFFSGKVMKMFGSNGTLNILTHKIDSLSPNCQLKAFLSCRKLEKNYPTHNF